MSEPTYDAENNLAYVKVREGEHADTRELVSGEVFADFDKDGLLLGVEILGPKSEGC